MSHQENELDRDLARISERTSQTLETAAAYIVDFGYISGAYHDEDGQVCAVGAIFATEALEETDYAMAVQPMIDGAIFQLALHICPTDNPDSRSRSDAIRIIADWSDELESDDHPANTIASAMRVVAKEMLNA